MKFKKIVIIFLILACLFLFLEIATRLILFSKGQGFFREPRFINPWLTVYDAPVPVEREGILYFKRRQKARKTPERNTIRIICLGGSTTVNAATRSHYPARLQDKLNKFYKNVSFEVLNAGGDAFSSAHSLINFSLRLAYYHPDYVIVYHNINDLSANYFPPRLETDYANKYMSNLFLAPECKRGIQRHFLNHDFYRISL